MFSGFLQDCEMLCGIWAYIRKPVVSLRMLPAACLGAVTCDLYEDLIRRWSPYCTVMCYL